LTFEDKQFLNVNLLCVQCDQKVFYSLCF